MDTDSPPDPGKRPAKRAYKSPLREKQLAETRERIINAGVKLIHEIPNWEWKTLTYKAISDRAGVSERTVYRHFPTEREMKDAIMRKMVDSSGVDLTTLRLSDFANVTAQVFAFLSNVASTTPIEDNPTFASIDEHRRERLLNAVATDTPGWTEQERENVTALLDILWNVPPYERLIKTWQFDNQRATKVTAWLIQLILEAIKNDNRPR